jgi:hypothetical protein
MPTFYKCLIRGTTGAQEINNILYYAPVIPSELAFNPDDAADLGAAVGSAWMTQLGSGLPTTYTCESVDVSMVDEDGVTVSPYVVPSLIGIDGQATGVTEGFGGVAIAKFNCTPVAEAPGHPVPRRSYIAIGPLTNDDTASNGALSTQATWQTRATAATTQGHLINAVSFVPYRVGRTELGSVAGVGRVVAVIVRPFASFRRSRIQRPTGN